MLAGISSSTACIKHRQTAGPSPFMFHRIKNPTSLASFLLSFKTTSPFPLSHLSHLYFLCQIHQTLREFCSIVIHANSNSSSFRLFHQLPAPMDAWSIVSSTPVRDFNAHWNDLEVLPEAAPSWLDLSPTNALCTGGDSEHNPDPSSGTGSSRLCQPFSLFGGTTKIRRDSSNTPSQFTLQPVLETRKWPSPACTVQLLVAIYAI